MKNLKKIKLHEGDQVLNDLQLKKIVGGIYVAPEQPGGGTDYCSTMRCVYNPEIHSEECWGACRCAGILGTPCVRW